MSFFESLKAKVIRLVKSKAFNFIMIGFIPGILMGWLGVIDKTIEIFNPPATSGDVLDSMIKFQNDMPEVMASVIEPEVDTLKSLVIARNMEKPQSCQDILYLEDEHTKAALDRLCTHVDSAECALNDGNYALAEEIYRHIINYFSDHPIILFNIAYCCFVQDSIKEAISYFEKAIKKSTMEDSIYLKACFNLGLIYLNLSQTHHNFKNIDSSFFYIKKSIEIYPNDTLNRTYYTTLLLERGLPEDYHKVIAYADDVIAITTNYAVPWRIKGSAYYMLKMYGPAASAYLESIQIDSNQATAYFGLGSVYMQQGKTEQAAKEYRKAIKLDSNYAEAYCYLGKTLSKLDSLDRAIRVYDKSIQIDPENSETHYNRGLALHQKGKYPDAINEFNIALELNSDYTIAYYNIGNAYYENDELDSAIFYYGAALKLKPEVQGFHYKLVEVCRENGMSKKEIKNYIDSILGKNQEIPSIADSSILSD